MTPSLSTCTLYTALILVLFGALINATQELSLQTSTTVTTSKLKTIFPQFWSPLTTGKTPTAKDANGFEFKLTERNGQKQSYNGFLQIHASTEPQWLQMDVFGKDLSYHFNANRKSAKMTVDIKSPYVCMRLNFSVKNNTLAAKVASFAKALLDGKQTTYKFPQSLTKYDGLVNQFCNSNAAFKLNAFQISDESVLACSAARNGSSTINDPKYFITKSLLITVGKVLKGTFKNHQKKCISLDKFDARLAETLGDRYFGEIVSDSITNQNTLTSGLSRPTFWFETKADSCTLPSLADKVKCASYNAGLKPTKTCIFIHGAGGLKDLPPRNTSYSDYWGDIENWTPQCKTRVFPIRKTVIYGWDDASLQKYYCDIAVQYSGVNVTSRGVPVLKNVVIFSHSQGGLVIAAALKKSVCKLDTSTSSWYSVSSPFQGSEVVSKLIKYCYAYKHEKNILSKDFIYGYFANRFGYCDPNSDKPYPGYMSLAPNYCSGSLCTNQLYTSAQASSHKPAGRMCGSSPIGILSKYSLMFSILSSTTDISNPNDGMVEYSSCISASSHTLTPLYSNTHYDAVLNHADTSCRNGNGWFSGTKQPCLYYKDKK